MKILWTEYNKIKEVLPNSTVSSIKFEQNGQAYCYVANQDGKVVRLLLSRIGNNERLVMGVEKMQVDTCAYNHNGEVIANCGDPIYVLENPNGFSLWQQWQEREWEEQHSRSTIKLSPRNVAHRGRV